MTCLATICLVRPEDLPGLWPDLAGLVERALESGLGCYRAEDVRGLVEAGTAQLWLEARGRACCITELVQYPRRRSCRIFLLAGDGMAAWLPQFSAVIEAWARAQGCDLMEASGRRGWTRVAQQFGWRPWSAWIAKEI